MHDKSETDVLVVGAGPVGLMLACELNRRDVAFRIIDKVSAFPQTSRANGLAPRSLEILDSLGLVEQIVARSYPVNGASIRQNGRELFRFEMTLDQEGHASLHPDQPYRRAVLVNQAVVEGVLREKLVELGGQVECQRELRGLDDTSHGVIAQVADLGSGTVERIATKWLVGCDGAHSTLRAQLGLPMEGKEYPEHLVLADVHLEGDLPKGVTILWLNDQGLLAGAPFREPGLWRLMAVVTPDAQGNVPTASVELFQRLLVERAGDTTIKLGEPVWLSNFVVHHRMVSHYRKGHVFVAGDAAHLHSPAGGQGMNTGIQDSFNLGWKLALVVKRFGTEELLNTYEAERLPVARHVLAETDTNQQLEISHRPMAEFLRNHVVFPLLRMPALREPVLELMMRRGSELDINYRSSSLSEQPDHPRSGPEAGDRAPDGRLLDQSGKPTSVFAQFRTPHFRLLLFQGISSPANVADLTQIALRVGDVSNELVRACLILGPQSTADVMAPEVTVLCDPDHGTHNTYGAHSPCVYLVRPDGYIGFRSGTVDESKLIDYLQRNFVAAQNTSTQA